MKTDPRDLIDELRKHAVAGNPSARALFANLNNAPTPGTDRVRDLPTPSTGIHRATGRRVGSTGKGLRYMGLGPCVAGAAGVLSTVFVLDRPIRNARLLFSDPANKVDFIASIKRDGAQIYVGTNLPAPMFRIERFNSDIPDDAGLFLGDIENKLVLDLDFTAAATALPYLIGEYNGKDGADSDGNCGCAE